MFINWFINSLKHQSLLLGWENQNIAEKQFSKSNWRVLSSFVLIKQRHSISGISGVFGLSIYLSIIYGRWFDIQLMQPFSPMGHSEVLHQIKLRDNFVWNISFFSWLLLSVDLRNFWSHNWQGIHSRNTFKFENLK